MSSREQLSKLKIDVLKTLAVEHGVEIKKQKKETLINSILTCQAPLSALTPVINQQSEQEALHPRFESNENLPPFHKVKYQPLIHKTLPQITFSKIYQFMIDRQKKEGGQVANFKGLDKAVKHLDAGDVQEICYYKVDDKTYYVRAFCLASMKKHRYQVYVCISQNTNSPVIAYGYCQCPIGMAQGCSHIGGLLFALSKANHTRQPDVASTSKLCQWNVPRQSVMPQPLSKLSHKKPKLFTPPTDQEKSVSDANSFDPRHTMHQTFDMDRTLTHLQALKSIFPNTAMSHLWNIPDQVPSHVYEVEVTATEDPVMSKIKGMIITQQNVPPLNIDIELVEQIERATRQQRSSKLWNDLHLGRLTSSLFGSVLKAGQNPNSLVKQIIDGSSLNKYNKLPEAVQWGIDNEEKAKTDYINLQSAFNSDFSVSATGLTLCKTHSFLGASSDGKIKDCGNTGVLEIKCPFSVQGTKVNTLEVSDIIQLNSPTFCLEFCQGGIRLKKNHPYYAQVQGEMAIMGLPWCDFVVWTDALVNNICIDRVHFDIEFVQNMLPKLVEFYVKHVFPEFEK